MQFPETSSATEAEPASPARPLAEILGERFKQIPKDNGRIWMPVSPDGNKNGKWKVANGNFDNLNLTGFNFQGAELPSATFHDANVTDAIFWEANLRSADLSKSHGLLADALAGADLTNAKLPESFKEYPGLEEVQQLSQNAGKVSLTILATVAFVLITMAATPDSQLVTNGNTSDLPLIGAKVPIQLFYFASPVILFFLFLYFHIYLLRLWIAMARLPARFCDGRSVDEATYQWLLNDIGRSYFKRLSDRHPPLFRLQNGAAWGLGWMLVPVVQLLTLSLIHI